jgi:CheY-like chemotaxis protein
MTGNNALARNRVLVVEDELMIALDMCSKLEEMGYLPIGPVSTVDEALTLLEGERPDFALLDENLRGSPVTPVAEALLRRRIPFGLLSGYSRSHSAHEALRNAPRLSKPVNSGMISELLEKLSNGDALETPCRTGLDVRS